MTLIKTFSFDHATRATVKNPYVYSATSVTFISFHVPDFMICPYRGGEVGAPPPPLFNYLLFILFIYLLFVYLFVKRRGRIFKLCELFITIIIKSLNKIYFISCLFNSFSG